MSRLQYARLGQSLSIPPFAFSLQAVHHHFNQKLNAQVGISQHANYPGGKIRYQHTKEIDSFYSNQGDRSKKVRVTRNKDSGELKAGGSIIKSRVADMNIFSPKRKFDYRISISIEEPGEYYPFTSALQY